MAKKISIKYNGKSHSFSAGVSALDVMEKLKLDKKSVLAVQVGTETLETTKPILNSGELMLLTFNDALGKEIFWHSSAHVLADAIVRLYPNAKPTIGPPIEEGFYYDFDNLKISNEDFPKIEKEMKKIIHENNKFLRAEIKKAEAKKLFKNNKFKLEMVEDLDDISTYTTGKFVDLCRGPHIPSTKVIHAIKLTKLSGAYWRADAKKAQLTRIYGIAFPTKELLTEYNVRIVEAERRDHRKLGAKMDLFSFQDEGPGFVFWHAKGMIIYNSLMEFWREEHRLAGYEMVMTPIILKKELWLKSGHWDHYKENMYFTKIDNDDYAIKPMNCPGGILIYKNSKHSYREFPLRWAEVGLDHRHEMSGVLHGLMRVRSFWQDDAHIYCLPEQMEDEIIKVVELTDKIYKAFGFEYHIELSTRPEKFMGKKEDWDLAEATLAGALKKLKKKFVVNHGDGAFYGPKIDFHIRDSLGRTWQCATVQLDFQMPEKFDLTYMGDDGTENHRPAMIHRTVFGSFERFIGILIEHFAGKLPLWCAPNQVRILTIAEKFNDYAYKVRQQLFDAHIRVEVDESGNTIGKKIREAQLDKVNYMLVIGEKEVDSNTIAIRDRTGKQKFGVKTSTFVKKLNKEIKEKEF